VFVSAKQKGAKKSESAERERKNARNSRFFFPSPCNTENPVAEPKANRQKKCKGPV
jgi:hypothetical protein